MLCVLFLNFDLFYPMLYVLFLFSPVMRVKYKKINKIKQDYVQNYELPLTNQSSACGLDR